MRYVGYWVVVDLRRHADISDLLIVGHVTWRQLTTVCVPALSKQQKVNQVP